MHLNLKPRPNGDEPYEGELTTVPEYDVQVLFDAINRAHNITHETYKFDERWLKHWNDFLAEWGMDFQHTLDDAFARHEEHIDALKALVEV